MGGSKPKIRIFAEVALLIFFIVIGATIVWRVNPSLLISEVPSFEESLLKEARYYVKMDNKVVQCQLCFRKCVISDGGRSFCRVRENRGGTLYTLVYGKTASWQIAPVEKDGMYHLLPGSKLLAFATASCNFRCQHCHNWTLTQFGPEDLPYHSWTPEEIVEMAIRSGAETISGTINEPTIFYEYLYDVAKAAKKMGLKIQFHTNGGISPEPLNALLEYTDGVVVDLKAFTTEFYQGISFSELEPVLKTLKNIKEEGIWLEITNLIIPTLNDDLNRIREMCVWIRDNLGNSVPLHFTRFFPAYKLTKLPPTPIETLEKAWEIAKEVGLNYVYIGNVPGHKFNKTFCTYCGEIVIDRIHFTVLATHLKDGTCRFCGNQIPGVWQ